MSKSEPKTLDELMAYLRDSKGILIEGMEQRQKLMNIGYYHGYKGYRYINKASNTIQYNNFDELIAIYDFDTRLKALFYPYVMQIETAIKNYVLDSILSFVHSDSFIDIYNTLLDNYKRFSPSVPEYKKEIKRRLDLRNRIYRVQSDAYGNGNKIAEHYLTNESNLPIWAIFELLSLGEFGYFMSCLNFGVRKNVSVNLGIEQRDDTEAMMPQRLIYATKDLRNAIAHNDVIFDTRFKTNSIKQQVSNAITNHMRVSNITFKTITDYLILIVYQLSLIKVSKDDILKLINGFEECTEELRSVIPINVYNQIILTDNKAKIRKLREFVSM